MLKRGYNKMPKIQESIQKISGKKQYRITIPFEIMKAKGWEKYG